ncbi:serine/threonine-protein kinase mos [Patella vulgata]|uniref:serine/threonine-protein kinase mos n=1 Tax=Patella vulgata TaxID=6465 RepID=UPI0024A7F813|nr:serine/threonine-protein kinase mos [Patella vulgata]
MPADVNKVSEILMVSESCFVLDDFEVLPQTPFEDLASRFLNKDDYDLGKLLGAGGFGSVYLASYKNKITAVKTLHKVTKNPKAQMESYKAELNVYNWKHPNIVRTVAATSIEQYDTGAWIVMEYIGSRNLQMLINDTEEELDQQRRLKYSLEVASALEFTHSNHIVHLDLKPANILLTERDSCKLGDFGCCQRVEEDTGRVSPTNRSALTGTFAYRAPELLRGGAPTLVADVYSYGVTLWQLLSRETPYSNQNQHVVIFSVVSKHLRPPHPDVGDDPFELLYQELYTQCWSANPETRPTSRDLVELLKQWKYYM